MMITVVVVKKEVIIVLSLPLLDSLLLQSHQPLVQRKDVH
jgi:hypothetical protein